MAHLLVTGADGFVGSRLTAHLISKMHEVTAAVRRTRLGPPLERVVFAPTGDIEQQPDWAALLKGVDGVIHLAGRAHVMHNSRDPLGVARRANVAPTLNLFRACQRAHIARFVYVSSVHVNGTDSGPVPFTESTPAAPQDPYAQSKWEAECALQDNAAQAGAPQLVVVRPTVICGANVKGNLARLVRLVSRNLPLPFGAVSAPRNFVGINNLCDLLERCVMQSSAAGNTYLAADPETLTLPVLIRSLASAIGLRARLLPVPPTLLSALGVITGQRKQIARLTHSLLVDSSLARHDLGWRSDVPLERELLAMARAVALNR